MNLEIATILFNAVLFFLVYSIAVTISGAFKAWVAYQCGDETAQEEGYMTLNPVMHIDPLGLLCFYLLHFGWGHRIPIDSRNIPDRKKLVLTYLSDSFINIITGIIALVALVALFGPSLLQQSTVSYAQVRLAYPHYSAFTYMIMIILRMLISLSAWLAALSGITNAFKVVILLFYPEKLDDSDAQFFIQFGPLLLMIAFINPLMSAINLLINYAGYFIASLLQLI